jgi:hypothetical protein
VSEKRSGQWLIKNSISVEIEGETTPALIAEIISMVVVGDEQSNHTGNQK